MLGDLRHLGVSRWQPEGSVTHFTEIKFALDALLQPGVAISDESGRLLEKGGVFGSRRTLVVDEWIERWKPVR